MPHSFRPVLTSVICLAMAGPAFADGITGAGSGSNGGTLTGKTNENGTTLKTGADNGEETVPSKQDRRGIGTGDNAVLNAPRETIPDTKSGSQPSNLNGQSPKP